MDNKKRLSDIKRESLLIVNNENSAPPERVQEFSTNSDKEDNKKTNTEHPKKKSKKKKIKKKPKKEYYDLRILSKNENEGHPLWIGRQKFNNNFPIYKFLVEKSSHTINKEKLANREDWQEIKKNANSDQELAQKLLSGKNNKREWFYEYANLWGSRGELNSFQGLTNHSNLIQIYEQFNWYVWSVAYFYFQNSIKNEKLGLPPHDNDAWVEGFTWKGVYFRLIPLQHKYLFKKELEAIKHITLELEE